MVDIFELHAQYALENTIRVHMGPEELPVTTLTHSSGDEVSISLYGAHALHWRVAGEEKLYLSPRTSFEKGKAIRGGIPLVFPQFGVGQMPPHGFARILGWSIAETGVTSASAPYVIFQLESSDETKVHWGADFKALVRFELGQAELRQLLEIHNVGSKELSFQQAFHTYFRIPERMATQVAGLQGVQYLDSLQDRAVFTEERASVGFARETDRIYQNAPDALSITHKNAEIFRIEKSGMRDAVVWNPGAERCSKIADLPPDAFEQYICVEPGNVVEAVCIDPGKKWKGEQSIKAC